jgi:hypothetical protein
MTSRAHRCTAKQVAAQVRQAIAGGNQRVANRIANRWVDLGDTLYFGSRRYQLRFAELHRQGLRFIGSDWTDTTATTTNLETVMPTKTKTRRPKRHQCLPDVETSTCCGVRAEIDQDTCEWICLGCHQVLDASQVMSPEVAS